ncbi:50S ribosomal protein L25 [Brucepastera parasyntrophica]|uniref:50S ribosomal protein L25 n=1 Tax=Brucepastera parasyntrophica TaxID=2880008 RepID=UPI00210EC3BB|nr:50S ribosomal protein L25 [Brucepastera parasyntrophica]ULQ60483.1 50S ribosomal protein L25 [Brucepastera parasyntrophica]
MAQKTINAKTRTEVGKGAAKRLRKSGRMPGVLYDGTGKSVLIDIDFKDFSQLFHSITESTLIDVKLDDSVNKVVFVKDAQYDIITDSVKHVDFYEVDPSKKLRTKIHIKLSGSPEGIRVGGVLETGISEVEVECLPRDLPERIVVDVGGLGLNHSIHVKDLQLGTGVKILTDPDITIAVLKYTKAGIPAEGESSGA